MSTPPFQRMDGPSRNVYVTGGQAGIGDLTLDAWGTPKFVHPWSLFHGMWTYDIPMSMWFMYHNGTQVYSSSNITSVNGAARLTADATNSTVLMESRECPRYQPNRGHLFSMAGWFPSKTADGVRDFGLFTIESGVFFRLKADGKLYAVLRRGSVDVLEEEIDTTGLTGFDVEKNNIYDIQFQWRGAGNYAFFIGDPAAGASKRVHTLNLLGTLTGASSHNPAQPAAFKATRTTADVEMNISCADITSEGGNLERHQFGSASAANVAVATATENPVIVVRNPLQISGETNTRTVQLARITVTCDKKATFHIHMTRDPSLITGATYAPINSGSYVETDSPDMNASAVRATAISTTTMQFVTSVPVQANETRAIDNPLRERIHFPIVRGDYLVIGCEPSANGSADVVVEWGEEV